jgi:hypothetical protein
MVEMVEMADQERREDKSSYTPSRLCLHQSSTYLEGQEALEEKLKMEANGEAENGCLEVSEEEVAVAESDAAAGTTRRFLRNW